MPDINKFQFTFPSNDVFTPSWETLCSQGCIENSIVTGYLGDWSSNKSLEHRIAKNVYS